MAFSFTILANSTTANANDVMNNFYHVRRGDLLPLGGTSMAPTTGALDVGNASFSWRDGRFSRDVYARSIRSQANFAGYLEWSSDPLTTVYDSVTASTGPNVIIPPFKAEINGQTYVHGATTTLDFATTTSWLSGQSNATANSFVWVYAIPTTTGDAVVKLDDVDPSQTFSTISAGLYHISTTTHPGRAIHAMRMNSSKIMLRYQRRGNDMHYIPHSTTTETARRTVNHVNWVLNPFVEVPAFDRVRSIDLNINYRKNTSTNMDIRVLYTTDNAFSTGSVLLADSPQINGQTLTASITIRPTTNSAFFRWFSSTFNTSAAGAVQVHPSGYNLKW